MAITIKSEINFSLFSIYVIINLSYKFGGTMKETVKIRTDLLNAVREHISSFYDEKNIPLELKVEEMLAEMIFLFEGTKEELRNYFIFDEVGCLCDAFNGIMYMGGTSMKKFLITEYEAYLKCNDCNLNDTFSEDERITLYNKLKRLTEFQAYVVFLQLREFWNKEKWSIDEIHELFFVDRVKVNG